MNRITIVLVFLTELVLSESIFLLQCERKQHFLSRCIPALAAYAAAVVGLDTVFNLLPQTVPFRIVFFLLFASFSVPAVLYAFQMPAAQAIFITIAGYSTQHIADAVIKIVITTFGLSPMTYAGYLLLSAAVYGLCLLLAYFVIVRRSQFLGLMHYGDRRVLVISGMNLVLCLGLSVVIDDIDMASDAQIICKIYAILGCLLCLAAQAGLLQNGRMEQTNQTLHQMMEMERRQHQISKETIELINIKCHDMKHQIDKLATQSEEKRSRNISELSQAILIYDSMLKTGCAALDMVLMEKKLLCEKYGICFTFLGDGTALNCVDEEDIYSLFGNMLDNAIESLSQEQDPEKRLITLRINHYNSMLYICMENYCSTPIVIRDGELQTTKQNEPGMHGYGIKSIRYIVSRYKGDMTIDTADSRFTLEIMLPDLTEKS